MPAELRVTVFRPGHRPDPTESDSVVRPPREEADINSFATRGMHREVAATLQRLIDNLGEECAQDYCIKMYVHAGR